MKSSFKVKREQLQVVQEGVFDAPPEQIWKVLTDPESIPHWWGPRDSKTTVETMDLRPGGAWRFINRGADGNDYGFHGVYKEIDSPKRISNSFNFEGIPGNHELVETLVLEDLGNDKTKLTSTAQYKVIEDLEGMVSFGMEKGATESWERLAELVK